MSTPDRIAFRSEQDVPLLNMVLNARLGHDVGREVERIVAEFTSHGRPWTWWVTPSFGAADLNDALQHHGLVPRPIFGLERSAAVPPRRHRSELRFEPVEPANPEFLSTLLAARAMPAEAAPILGELQRSVHPHTSVYVVAHDGNGPVGTGTGFPIGDVFEIHNVSTIAGHEVGAAIVAHLVTLGSAHRYRYATGIVDEDELELYEAVGFEIACETTQWIGRP